LLNPDTGSYYVEYLRSVETVALLSSVQATLAPVHNAGEIETTIKVLAREPGGSLIVLPSAPITAHIDLVIGLAAQFRTPAVYPFGSYARQGGLLSAKRGKIPAQSDFTLISGAAAWPLTARPSTRNRRRMVPISCSN
jgi:hypothetical protein